MDQNPFPLKTTLAIEGEAANHDAMMANVTEVANRFFSPSRWRLLSVTADAVNQQTTTRGDVLLTHFTFTAHVAGPIES